jgi:hypothetical protein
MIPYPYAAEVILGEKNMAAFFFWKNHALRVITGTIKMIKIFKLTSKMSKK